MERRSFWLMIPPPLLFLAVFLAGMLLDHLAPLATLPEKVQLLSTVVGAVLVGLSALLMLWGATLFLKHRTTIIPHATNPRSLLVSGPYRFTRNPLYLGVVMAFLGAALLVHALWPFLLLAFPVWVVARKVIPFEESNLARIFGDEYRSYSERVRRWL